MRFALFSVTLFGGCFCSSVLLCEVSGFDWLCLFLSSPRFIWADSLLTSQFFSSVSLFFADLLSESLFSSSATWGFFFVWLFGSKRKISLESTYENLIYFSNIINYSLLKLAYCTFLTVNLLIRRSTFSFLTGWVSFVFNKGSDDSSLATAVFGSPVSCLLAALKFWSVWTWLLSDGFLYFSRKKFFIFKNPTKCFHAKTLINHWFFGHGKQWQKKYYFLNFLIFSYFFKGHPFQLFWVFLYSPI